MTARPVLTEDQRWLLRAVGGWKMRDCLIGPDGVADLMKSMYSSTAGKVRGGPDWVARGFSCGRGKIVAPWDGAIVTVTAAQINRYAKTIPDDLIDELKACQRASVANARLRGRFCYCTRAFGNRDRCGYAWMRDRICPPTEQQEADASAEYWRVHDWTEDLLDRALGFAVVDEAAELVGQLALFAVTS